MLIKIDFENDIPIYEQLKRQIIQGIAKGELQKGENLPSVRQMAEDIGINLHTVNKAYNNLKAEGYVVVDRRKGATISDKLPEKVEEFTDNLKEELEFIIANVKCRGYTKEEFLKLCNEIFNDYNGE